MFSIHGNGLLDEIRLPEFGRQSLGIVPGGAADELGFLTGYILLDYPRHYRALEIIFPPRQICFNQEVLFSLTGAGFPDCKLLQGGKSLKVQHARVYLAQAGDRLLLSGLKSGLRTYLLVREFSRKNRNLIDRQRGDMRRWFIVSLQTKYLYCIISFSL